MKENDETPSYEARSHSKKFLKEAEHMKESMGGKKEEKKEMKGKAMKKMGGGKSGGMRKFAGK